MLRKIKQFLENDSGAITVDWVVLTASAVGLAIAAWATVYDSSVTGVTQATGDALGAYNDDVFN